MGYKIFQTIEGDRLKLSKLKILLNLFSDGESETEAKCPESVADQVDKDKKYLEEVSQPQTWQNKSFHHPFL